MQLLERDKVLELPAGTVFGRFYPELMTADIGVDHIRPHPFTDLCIKGQTIGANFEYSSLTDCLEHPAAGDERQHMALCYGATDFHFGLDLAATRLDEPVGHSQSVHESGREIPPRQLYAVWTIDELDALITRLQNASKHLRNALGLEI